VFIQEKSKSKINQSINPPLKPERWAQFSIRIEQNVPVAKALCVGAHQSSTTASASTTSLSRRGVLAAVPTVIAVRCCTAAAAAAVVSVFGFNFLRSVARSAERIPKVHVAHPLMQ
jgi:hypothetical protein